MTHTSDYAQFSVRFNVADRGRKSRSLIECVPQTVYYFSQNYYSKCCSVLICIHGFHKVERNVCSAISQWWRNVRRCVRCDMLLCTIGRRRRQWIESGIRGMKKKIIYFRTEHMFQQYARVLRIYICLPRLIMQFDSGFFIIKIR